MVRVYLYDEGVVELTRRAAEDIYDTLWILAPQRGAVTTAAKLHQALRQALLDPVELDLDESQAFTDAHARIA